MAEDRIDLTELEVFLTLAHERHFGRTAERLGLSQPRVSQLIRSLERRIGRRVVERTSRTVTLNALGEKLLADAGPAFAALRNALDDVQAAGRYLRIGFLGSFGSALDPAIDEFRKLHPDCPVSLVQVPWPAMLEPLRRGEVDMFACLAPIGGADLMVGPTIAEFDRTIAVGVDHPLSLRRIVDLEDLAGVPIIRPDSSVPDELADTYWPPPQTPSGKAIPHGPTARTEAEMLTAVAHGEGVFIASTAMPQHFNHPGVAFRPFTGMPTARVVLVWRRDADHDKIATFARLADSAVGR